MTTAAIAPAPPATMKLGALQRKSSCQTCHRDFRVDSAIAAATMLVLTTKCVVMMPTMGLGRLASGIGAGEVRSHAYASAVACIVIAASAMLKTEQYSGYGRLTLNVHCVQAAAAAITMACGAPNSSSDIRL